MAKMTKMKTLVFVLATILFTGASFAQTIEDGKRFLYYERFKSAKDIFQKLSTANAADESAAYYLGQAMIGLEDVAGAKALYQQKLSATPNSPLILVGMGHIGLLEGNTADARSRFETAINLSGAKRIDVFNAVGAANSNPENKNGDANYAIDKLKFATTLKGFKDPEVWANLGDAYRKSNDGTNAAISYQSALTLNPIYARAKYRTGRLYQSQGLSQEPLFLRLYNETIAMDPNYAPVYNTLFNYFFKTDVTKSAGYLEKWLSVSDDDPKACLSRASMKFAQGLNLEAIAKCEECISVDRVNALPNLFGLKAAAYVKMNDSVNAKSSFEEYFKRQIPSKVGSGDYSSYALTLLKFSGNEQIAADNINKAVAIDSLEKNKVDYLKVMAVYFKDKGNFLEAANWYNKVLYVKKNYNNVDLYNAGYNYFRSAKFDSSVVVFNKYTVKYPDDMFGYYMVAKANSGIDSTMALGTAATAYLKAIEVGEKAVDKVKIKDQLVGAYTYMMQYSFNVKRDQAAAISYIDKALLIDPADAQSIQNKEFVTKNNPASKPTTKPSTKTGVKPATAAGVKPKTTAAVPEKKK
jgi:tetratricopeptide (TPR) repeat protein